MQMRYARTGIAPTKSKAPCPQHRKISEREGLLSPPFNLLVP